MKLLSLALLLATLGLSALAAPAPFPPTRKIFYHAFEVELLGGPHSAEEVRRLLDEGDSRVVIAAGGGGTPVIRRDGRLVGFEAVIDKDVAAALLGRSIRWTHLVIATDVPQVALDYGKPSQRFLDHLSITEAKKHLAAGQFPPGSMGPKIEAAIDFLEGGGERVVITDLEHLVPAAAGKAGTRIGKK